MATVSPFSRCLLHTALFSAALFGASGVQAEPFQLQQTVNSSESAPLDSVVQMRATDDHLIVYDESDALSLYARDDAGLLSHLDTLQKEEASNVIGGHYETILKVVMTPENKVLVNGRLVPTGCADTACDETVIDTYEVDEAGLFSRIGRQPLRPSDTHLRHAVFTPDGKHLYSAHSSGNEIVAYTINRMSELTLVSETGRFWRQDGSLGHVQFLEVISDTLLVAVDDGVLISFRRDPVSGELSALSEFDLRSRFSDPQESARVVSLKALSNSNVLIAGVVSAFSTEGEKGLLRITVGEDGTFSAGDIDESALSIYPNNASHQDQIAISPNGRLLSTAAELGGENALNLYTVDDNNTLTYRDSEREEQDGVVEDDLFRLTALTFSPDNAFLYAGNSDRDTLLVFAAHADLSITAEALSSTAEQNTGRAQLTAFNRGDAVAHGIQVSINSQTAIKSVESPGTCRIMTETTAACEFDRLLPVAGVDIQVETDLSTASNTLSAAVTAIQTDRDSEDNQTSVVLSAQSGDASKPEQNSNSAKSSGGCSIAGRDSSNGFLWLMVALAAVSVVVRRKARL